MNGKSASSILHRALWASACVFALSRCAYPDEEEEPSALPEPAAQGASPLATYGLPEADRIRFGARVVERLVAGSYTYLEVERAHGDRAWVVTLSDSAGAAAGIDDVDVIAVGHARDFASKRLKRRFDDLYFAVVRPR
jgi:hypothetical protein